MSAGYTLATPRHEQSVSIQFLLICVVIAVPLMHTLRSLGMVYYGLLVAAVVGGLMLVLARGLELPKSYGITLYWLLWLEIALVAWLSLGSVPASTVLSSVLRLVVAPSTLLFMYAALAHPRGLQVLLRIYVALCVGATLTLLIQVFTGPLPILGRTVARTGLVRYSSLHGDVTIIGISNGIGLVIAALLPARRALIKAGTIALVVLGLVLSLQKAAVMNLGLAFLIWALLSGRRRLVLRTALVVGLLLVAFVVLGRAEVLPAWIVDYVDGFVLSATGLRLFESSASQVSNYRIINLLTLTERFTILPAKVAAEIGWDSVVFGAGVLGGGGAMGIRSPQSHNTVFDLLFIGGLPLLAIFVGLSIHTLKTLFEFRSWHLQRFRPEPWIGSTALVGGVVLFFINMPYTSIAFFHPSMSFVFWLGLAASLRIALDRGTKAPTCVRLR